MSETDKIQGQKQLAAPQSKKKRSHAGKIVGSIALGLLFVIALLLLVNAMLTLFLPHYYPTFGKYRLFAVVTDSMEPGIKTGSLIVAEKPISADEIKPSTSIDAKDGTVITFEVLDNDGNVLELLTHRVVGIEQDGDTTYYITRGDNAAGDDRYRPDFGDVVGIYTGKSTPVLGYIIGFLQSSEGAAALFAILFIIIVAWVTLDYMSSRDRRQALESKAIKKSAQQLSNVNLRYDNIREITAVMDVLGMVGEEPKNRADRKMTEARLIEFIEAESIELPQTPETAAVLDSLPAPDTPLSLAAALRSGATLRQAEDGQTLILTSMSGGKSIMLTPVQTPDGIILCQQGVRLRSDIAPNIENIGATSMPDYPEFFEGMPLKKSVEYPELPQPNAPVFDAELLSPHKNYIDGGAVKADKGAALAAAPTPTGDAKAIAVGEARPSEIKELTGGHSDAVPPAHIEPAEKAALSQDADEQPKKAKPPALKTEAQILAAERRRAARLRAKENAAKKREEERRMEEARLAYAQYRELSAQLQIKQTEELHSLLNDVEPMTPEDRARVAEYRKAHQAPKKPRKQRTPEQIAAAKARAEQKKAEKAAFLDALSPADRELYLTEQQLIKSRAASIRKLKRLAADRKLLDNLETK